MLSGFTKSRGISSGDLGAAPPPGPPPRWIHDSANATLVSVFVWVLVVRFTVPGFFNYTTEDAEAVATSGVVDFLTNQMVWIGLIIAPLFVLRSRWALTLRLLGSVNIMLLVLTVYAVLSIFWSIDPGATLRKSLRIVAFVVASLAACLVAYEPRRFQDSVRPVVTALCLGSVIFGLIRPDLALTEPNYLIGEHDRHLRGLAVHKNQLGALASFGVLLWFHGWLSKELKRGWAFLGTVICGLCLFLSGSSTSILTTFFTIGFFVITQIAPTTMRRFMPYLVVLFIGVIVCYALAILKIAPGLDALVTSVTSATGKDPTFTGRTPIWELVKEHIDLSPVFGSGYAAYWTGNIPGTASSIMKKKLYFYPDEAHEGYLDVINDLGYVGLVFLIGFCIIYVVLALRLLKIDRTQAVLYIGLMFYELLHNLSESSWVGVSVNWLVLVFASIATSRALLEQKLQMQFGPSSNRQLARKPFRERRELG